jgi:broad specificity phosphatase PhoE
MNSVINSTAAPSLLLLIRHAEQQTLRKLDPPLGERGREQADRLADRLSAIPLMAIASSPMARARATARPLAKRMGLTEEIVDDLAEADLSAAENHHIFTNTSARHMEPNADDYLGPARAAVEVLPRFQWGRDGRSETGENLLTRVTDAFDEVVARSPRRDRRLCLSGGSDQRRDRQVAGDRA